MENVNSVTLYFYPQTLVSFRPVLIVYDIKRKNLKHQSRSIWSLQFWTHSFPKSAKQFKYLIVTLLAYCLNTNIGRLGQIVVSRLIFEDNSTFFFNLAGTMGKQFLGYTGSSHQISIVNAILYVLLYFWILPIIPEQLSLRSSIPACNRFLDNYCFFFG